MLGRAISVFFIVILVNVIATGRYCVVSCMLHFALCTQIQLGLVVDLTNTSRFYRCEDIADHDCKYVKLQCRG